MSKRTTRPKISRTGGRRADRALGLFSQGFNCSQAVLAVFAPGLGLDRKNALRLAQSFGAGLARRAETCGAVTGGLMVIGLKHGKVKAKDDAAKEKTYRLAQDFMGRFQARHGSLRCRALLGHDIGTARGLRLIKEKGLHNSLCPKFIRTAVGLLENVL